MRTSRLPIRFTPPPKPDTHTPVWNYTESQLADLYADYIETGGRATYEQWFIIFQTKHIGPQF